MNDVRTACEVLVCFAVKEEARSFRKLAAGHSNISILVTGMGRTNSEKTVREFMAKNIPGTVLTCGFAGGLNPEMKPGAVVFSTDNQSLRERLLAANAQLGKMFCAEKIAITAGEKRLMRESTSADVVEMESEAIQNICCERGIPCATVRAISDTANEDLPLDFNHLSTPDMNLNYAKLAWAIAKAPGKITDLLRLQKRCRLAADNLADVLAKILFVR